MDPPRELVEAMANDPEDQHVLATALTAGAEVLVTSNLSTFRFCMRALRRRAPAPDEFVKHLVDLDPAAIGHSITKMADRRRNPLATPEDVRAYLGDKYLSNAMRLLAEVRPEQD